MRLDEARQHCAGRRLGAVGPPVCRTCPPTSGPLGPGARLGDVAALVAHVCPDLAMFDMLAAATIEGPPAVTDAAELLRQFNRPGWRRPHNGRRACRASCLRRRAADT